MSDPGQAAVRWNGSEGEFQVLRGAGFAGILTLALLLQRLRPHARLRGSRWVHSGLWFTNLIVVGVVCGACACTVARTPAAPSGSPGRCRSLAGASAEAAVLFEMVFTVANLVEHGNIDLPCGSSARGRSRMT